MKIVSKYKDYYDGIQAMGFDESLVYVRHESVKTVKKPISYKSYVENSNDTLELDRINLETGDHQPNQEHIDCQELEVGFCGKLYPAIVFRHVRKEVEVGKKVFYNSRDIIKYLNQLESEFKKLFYRCSFYNYYFEKPTIKYLDEYFNQKKYEQNYTNWFQEFKTPIFRFTIDPNQKGKKWNDVRDEENLFIISNPNLKDLDFFRVKDNYSAYQEISQFISGVLSNTEINESNLTDKEKVTQHGFDLKYGFRTRPKNK
jgi:hypothetical protein